MTSHVVKKERCPECAKRGADTRGNNLAIYSDGHSYCFGCGFVSGSKKILTENVKEIAEDNVELPVDCGISYSPQSLEWLYSYGFTHSDLIKSNVLYSLSYDMLVFPYFNDKMLLIGWQGRYFGSERDHPKWKTFGRFKHIPYIANYKKEDCCIFVEDIVSWMKLAKYGHQVACLFGCRPNKELVSKYIELISGKFVWWLDHDKRVESIGFKKLCEQMGRQASCIFTTSDPKEYSSSQLEKFLCSK